MSPNDDSSQLTVDEILARYMEQRDRGQIVDREMIIRDNPRHAGELRAYFEASDIFASSRDDSTLTGPAPAAHATRLAAGSRLRYFGDYEILEEIARGGMGVVYKARQISLDRIVALKVILQGDFASEVSVRRFRREAEAAAQLDHPNIVPIYEVGEHDQTHYFTMKLVDGESLREARALVGREQKVAAALIMKIARAVDYAHRRGVVHRDLKPANVLIDSRGEPHVADFGLARRFGNQPALSSSDAIVGTPSYMAPEQAAGAPVVTTAVDIYAVGALLYDLLTGRPPFRGESTLETLRQVMQEEPPRPSSLRGDVDRDLEAISLRCLEKNPERRYGTAGELADDLERFLAGKVIHARPSTFIRRGSKWVRRQWRTVMVVSVFLTLASIAIALELAQRRAAVLRNVAQRHAADSRQRERIRAVLHQAVARNVRRSEIETYWPSFESDLEKRLKGRRDEELEQLVRRLSIQIYPDITTFGLVSDPPPLHVSFACGAPSPVATFALAGLEGSWDGGAWVPLRATTCSSERKRNFGGFGSRTLLAETFGKEKVDQGIHRLALRANVEFYDPNSFAKPPDLSSIQGARGSNWPELQTARMTGRETRNLGEHRLHLFATYPSSFPERVGASPSLASDFRLDRIRLVVVTFRGEDPACMQIEWKSPLKSREMTFRQDVCRPANTRPDERIVLAADFVGSFDLAPAVSLAGEATIAFDRGDQNKMKFDFAIGGGQIFNGRRKTFAQNATGNFGSSSTPVESVTMHFLSDRVIEVSLPDGSYEAEFRLEPSREVALATSRIDRFLDRPVVTRTRVEIVTAKIVR